MTGSKGGANKSEQPCILMDSMGYRMIKPRVVTSTGNTEESTHQLDARSGTATRMQTHPAHHWIQTQNTAPSIGELKILDAAVCSRS